MVERGPWSLTKLWLSTALTEARRGRGSRVTAQALGFDGGASSAKLAARVPKQKEGLGGVRRLL